MDCLILLRRLKCGDSELKGLNAVVWWLRWLSGLYRLKENGRVPGLHAKAIIIELRALLEVGAADEGPQRLRPIWSY
jgi:hypothetical protein